MRSATLFNLAGRLPPSSAHSMNARKCVHAQKPYPAQAVAHESSKVEGCSDTKIWTDTCTAVPIPILNFKAKPILNRYRYLDFSVLKLFINIRHSILKMILHWVTDRPLLSDQTADSKVTNYLPFIRWCICIDSQSVVNWFWFWTFETEILYHFSFLKVFNHFVH